MCLTPLPSLVHALLRGMSPLLFASSWQLCRTLVAIEPHVAGHGNCAVPAPSWQMCRNLSSTPTSPRKKNKRKKKRGRPQQQQKKAGEGYHPDSHHSYPSRRGVPANQQTSEGHHQESTVTMQGRLAFLFCAPCPLISELGGIKTKRNAKQTKTLPPNP